MQRKIRNISMLFWVLFIYIIAALGWWYISLQQQNTLIHVKMLEDARLEKSLGMINESRYQEEVHESNDYFRRKQVQFIGEGGIFLLMIIIGGVLVYRSLKKQMMVTAQQQNFVMAVTHELKTPIAVARLNLETIRKRKLEEAQQDKLIQNTINETGRLNDLINNILLASQIEGGRYLINEEDIELSELTRQTVKEFTLRFPDRKIEDSIKDGIIIPGDKLLLGIAINNLLENAIKYSPKESTVYVDLDDEGERYSLEITDEGYGIPDEEKRKVFDKFYRVGDENTRKTKGTGLGLYLTRKILDDHNADITLADNTPHGSIFAINFLK